MFDRLIEALDAASADPILALVERATDVASAIEFDGVSNEAPLLPEEAKRVHVSDGRDDASEGDVGMADDPADSSAHSASLDEIELTDAGVDAEADRRHHRLVVQQRSSAEFELPWTERLEVEGAATVFLRKHQHDARRWASAPRGRVDFRRTMRSSGEPVACRWRCIGECGRGAAHAWCCWPMSAFRYGPRRVSRCRLPALSRAGPEGCACTSSPIELPNRTAHSTGTSQSSVGERSQETRAERLGVELVANHHDQAMSRAMRWQVLDL